MNKGQNLSDAPQVPTFDSGDNSSQNQGNDGGIGNIGSDSEGHRSEGYSFDSTALERAAKAAKVSVFGLLTPAFLKAIFL